jgi:hypothetical protein
MAEHSINLGSHIQFNDKSNLTKKPIYMEHIIREVTQTELHPDNMNRKEGISLSMSWKPLIQIMNDCRKALSRHK